MKKFLVILMIIVSPAVFGQDAEKEVFDLSDDVLTENEKNFLDFYNNHWPNERKNIKQMIIDIMSLFKDEKTVESDAEEILSVFQEIIYGDEFLALAGIWKEGVVPNFPTIAALCNLCLFAGESLSEKKIIKGYRTLRYYCEEERCFPLAFWTSSYSEIYKKK